MLASDSINICDFSLLYGSAFRYYVPEKELLSHLLGRSNDNQTGYTSEEGQRLKEDIHSIYDEVINGCVQEKFAVIVAGFPGSGKTTLAHRYLEAENAKGRKIAYIDFNDVCLKKMARTWQSDMQYLCLFNQDHKREIQNEIDKKWRPGCIAAMHICLAHLIRNSHAFCIGDFAPLFDAGFLSFLKVRGYRIYVVHVTASCSLGWESIKCRDKTSVQTTEEEVKKNAALIPPMLNHAFLKYANRIDFYIREHFDKESAIAATWTKKDSYEGSYPGVLEICNHNAYATMKKIHNLACKDREDEWENSVERQLNE